MGEARSLEDRVADKEAQLKNALAKAEKYKVQLKQLQTKKANEDRKQRTHKLIVAGAELAALYGKTLEKDEVLAVVNFLRRQKEAGIFTISETKETIAEDPKEPITETKVDNGDVFGGFFVF